MKSIYCSDKYVWLMPSQTIERLLEQTRGAEILLTTPSGIVRHYYRLHDVLPPPEQKDKIALRLSHTHVQQTGPVGTTVSSEIFLTQEGAEHLLRAGGRETPQSFKAVWPDEFE